MTEDTLPREEAARFGGPDTEPAAVAASARISYQLTYARSTVNRRFSPGELTRGTVWAFDPQHILGTDQAM
ncbi:hypothetical protein ACIOBK_01770 [Micromonospora chokoriensis]